MAVLGDSFQNALDPQIHRTIPGAIPAAGAKHFLKFFRVNVKLVKYPLPLTIWLAGAGIMSRSMVSKERELTGIPILEPESTGSIPFIHDIKAVAGGAAESTGTAPQASQRLFLPEWIFKMALQKFIYLMEIKSDGRTRWIFRRVPRFFQPPLKQGSTAVGKGANLKEAVPQIHQHRIGASFSCGPQSYRSAKTIIIMGLAGQGDD